MQWRQEILSQLPGPPRPLTIGHRDFHSLTLPGWDGIASGDISPPSPAPNCSYFTHWTNPADSIHWPVEIQLAGRYRAQLYYACPASAVGTG